MPKFLVCKRIESLFLFVLFYPDTYIILVSEKLYNARTSLLYSQLLDELLELAKEYKERILKLECEVYDLSYIVRQVSHVTLFI